VAVGQEMDAEASRSSRISTLARLRRAPSGQSACRVRMPSREILFRDGELVKCLAYRAPYPRFHYMPWVDGQQYCDDTKQEMGVPLDRNNVIADI